MKKKVNKIDEETLLRIETEVAELGAKINKLKSFVEDAEGVFPRLPVIDKQLLLAQLSAMSTYGVILHTRIGVLKEN